MSPEEALVLRGIFESAPYARLPRDAPKELHQHVVDIENPQKVFAVHRARRRHGFQTLVEKFVVQLRHGCDSPACSKASCFTLRKRLAGTAPVRRYNVTSARNLAVYMASQPNPEDALCPFVKLSRDAPPAAAQSLIFASKLPPQGHGTTEAKDGAPDPKRVAQGKEARQEQAGSGQGSNQGDQSNPAEGRSKPPPKEARDPPGVSNQPISPCFTLHERPARKDYRSFSANIFGSVAFKMLEWLSPASIDNLLEKAEILQVTPDESPEYPGPRRRSPSSTSPAAQVPKRQDSVISQASSDGRRRESPSRNKESTYDRLENSEAGSVPKGLSQREGQHNRLRTHASQKAQRRMSLDPFVPRGPDDVLSPKIRAVPGSPDKGKKPLPPSNKNRRAAAKAVTARLDDNSQRSIISVVPLPTETTRPPLPSENGTPKGHARPTRELGTSHASSQGVLDAQDTQGPLEAQEDDNIDPTDAYPQALGHLDAQIIDFLCGVLEDDRTAEPTISLDSVNHDGSKQKATRRTPLRRTNYQGKSYPQSMKQEWKLFVQQTLFYVLSDPKLVIRAFTSPTDGSIDPRSVLQSTSRIWRVAPSLLSHSLWVAAANLFVLPTAAQALRSPTLRPSLHRGEHLTNAEAAKFMLVCLLSLASPHLNLGTDQTDLTRIQGLSAIRARGEVLFARGSDGASQFTVEENLMHDDLFGDEHRMRLASRIFAAIPTRKYVEELMASQMASDLGSNGGADGDSLVAVLTQIVEHLIHPANDMDAGACLLVLDWARHIMMQEWDGRAEAPVDGAFGGALALMGAMFNAKRSDAIPDKYFQAPFFAERLDALEAPAEWLTLTPTRQRASLLDYTFLFPDDSRVAFFRAVNFSRMRLAYEEAASLQNRLDTGPAQILNPYRFIMHDFLHRASTKFLVLEIRRAEILTDALDQLWRRQERELLRPLKVRMGDDLGEEGFDLGGVQQEFFRLAVAQALDPNFGAFSIDPYTRMAWFVPGSVQPEWKFELVGLVISLAVYNGLTLDVTFPRALYRRLLDQPVCELEHIADGWPDLAASFTTFLEWDENEGGPVEDVFCRTYEFSVSTFGVPVTRRMDRPNRPVAWPQFAGGRVVPSPSDHAALDEEEAPLVTGQTRRAFVGDYIRFLTDVSVAPQLEAFCRGFRRLLHPKALTLLSPALLQRVVEGEQEIDISELKRHATYEGWDARHPTVRDFWNIVKRYDKDMKKKLLEFVTASDRVPVGGMKNLNFVLQRNGDAVDEELYGDDADVEAEELLEDAALGLADVERTWADVLSRVEVQGEARLGDPWVATSVGEEATEGGAVATAIPEDGGELSRPSEGTIGLGIANNDAQVANDETADADVEHTRRRHRRAARIARQQRRKRPPPRLPSAYTCYGVLLLPVYKDKETLKERLAMALENAQGFGFA